MYFVIRTDGFYTAGSDKRAYGGGKRAGCPSIARLSAKVFTYF